MTPMKVRTDLDNFVALYKSFQVKCIVNKDLEGFYIKLTGDPHLGPDSTYAENIYSGFFSQTVIKFNEDGTFRAQLL